MEKRKQIGEQEMAHINGLLVLGFEAGSAAAMREQLSKILESFAVIGEARVGEVALSASMTFEDLRADEVGDSLASEVVLKLAPAEQDGYIKVRSVL